MKIHLLKPENHCVISQLTEKQATFFANGGNSKIQDAGRMVDWLNLVKQGEDSSFPQPVSFEWRMGALLCEKHKVHIVLSKDKDFSDCKTAVCQGNAFAADNLLLGQDYFWKVYVTYEDETIGCSEPFQFTTAFDPPRWIKAEGLSNIRDIGGWGLGGGNRIKQGLVYRGCEMEFHHTITDSGKNTLLHDLKIKTDLDLREEAVGKITHSVLGEEQVAFALIPAKAYDAFLAEEEKETCRKLFQLFTDRNNYPFYTHCWGGADRTGTLVFFLCALLGMREDDLFLDYELTSFSVWGERNRNSESFRSLLDGLQHYGTERDSLNTKCTNFILSTGITKEEVWAIRRILIENEDRERDGFYERPVLERRLISP